MTHGCKLIVFAGIDHVASAAHCYDDILRDARKTLNTITVKEQNALRAEYGLDAHTRITAKAAWLHDKGTSAMLVCLADNGSLAVSIDPETARKLVLWVTTPNSSFALPALNGKAFLPVGGVSGNDLVTGTVEVDADVSLSKGCALTYFEAPLNKFYQRVV